MKSKSYRVYLRNGHDLKKRLTTIIYANQRRHCIELNRPAPAYTKKEFYQWLINHKDFNPLLEVWIKSGFERDLIPSVDRLDNTKSYSFNNIRLVAFRENYRRPQLDKMNGVMKHDCTPVNQFDLNYNLINTFYSLHDADRKTGIQYKNIHKVCKGKRNTAGGYIWQYA